MLTLLKKIMRAMKRTKQITNILAFFAALLFFSLRLLYLCLEENDISCVLVYCKDGKKTK